MICVLCGRFFQGAGNNPWPLADHGSCCEDCNLDVLMARIGAEQCGRNTKEDRK